MGQSFGADEDTARDVDEAEEPGEDDRRAVTTEPGVQPVASSAFPNVPEVANVAADRTAASSPTSTRMPRANRPTAVAGASAASSLAVSAVTVSVRATPIVSCRILGRATPAHSHWQPVQPLTG